MQNIIIHNNFKDDINNYFNKYDEITECLYSKNTFVGLCEKSNLENFLKQQNLDKYCINLHKIYNKLSLISKKAVDCGKITLDIELISGSKQIIIYFFDKKIKYLNKFIYKISLEIVKSENNVVLLTPMDEVVNENKCLIINLIVGNELKRAKYQEYIIKLYQKNQFKKIKIEKNIIKKYHLTKYQFIENSKSRTQKNK